MKPFSRLTRSAFTLIELLVVIVIIAVLAGLIFPVVGKVRIRGVETRTVSNLRQIGAAMGAYGNDHDSMLPGPLSTEQYPAFGNDPKRDNGSLAKRLATYLGLSEKKSADKDQTIAADVLACPMSNSPNGVKLDDIAGFIMNMELVDDYGQPAWGDLKNEVQPLTRSALTAWRDTSSDATTKDAAMNLARRWAMRHTDQKDCAKLALSGDWVDKLPKEPVFGYNDRKPDEPGTYVTLFFDMHVESSYKPVYDKQSGK